MARPALSATRAFEIVDLLASSPRHAFTLSELVEQTGTNIASCHAILTALVRSGHLLRHPQHKTYRLGPALYAIGEAVAAQDPLLRSARSAAEQLMQETDLEVLLTARAGDDIIALARVANARFPQISMREGERIPLRPPFGNIYYAWQGEAAIQAWLASGTAGRPVDGNADRRNLAIVRRRGYFVALRSSSQAELTSAFASYGRRDEAEQQRIEALMANLYGAAYSPEDIRATESYDIATLSAPIFDAYGQVVYSMSLGGFPGPLTGGEIERHAMKLCHLCNAVSRAGEHAAPRRADARY